MSGQTRYRLGEFLASRETCSFLSLEEIDALAEGHLKGQRLEEFEAHRATCEHCQELLRDLDLFEELTEGKGVTDAERRGFEASQQRPAMRGRRWRYGLAAAAALIATIFFLMPSRDTEAIFTSPKLPVFRPPPTVRGASLRELWTSSAEAWERGDLRTARHRLEQGVALEPDSADLHFYLGVAFLFTDQPAEGARALERAMALRPEDPSESALWYAAIAYDRLDRRDEACDALERVSSLGGHYARKASTLLASRCPK